MKTISFSILFSILQLFLNPLFFAFLQQFTAGENLKVAGDSAGRRRILTTLPVICNLAVTRDCVLYTKSYKSNFFKDQKKHYFIINK